MIFELFVWFRVIYAICFHLIGRMEIFYFQTPTNYSFHKAILDFVGCYKQLFSYMPNFYFIPSCLWVVLTYFFKYTHYLFPESQNICSILYLIENNNWFWPAIGIFYWQIISILLITYTNKKSLNRHQVSIQGR